jgi:gliding motility-associated-like protein
MKMKLLNSFEKTFLLLLLLFSAVISSNAQNILTNGDFESGGSGVGFFVHDYTLINPLTGNSTPGTYARTTNPTLMNSTYISGGDHTTGTGNMLVVDCATTTSRFFWTTGSTGGAIVGFTPGTTYTFSYWIKSVSNTTTSDPTTRANIGVFFVNASAINPPGQSDLAPLPSEGWKKVSYSFVATADNVMVRLRTLNAGTVGCDFAVDDFSITQGGLPLAGSYSTVNPTCPNATDGSITVTLTGGTLPYGTYNLTGTSTQSSTNGIFNGLSAGTYNISVLDAQGQEYNASNIILTIPNELQLSSPITICQGESTPLSVTGGDGTYTWTANPLDSSITNPNAANQNVSPTVTTVYTVTSGSLSSPTNLVVNGNFSQGDTGFTTGYTSVADPNPFGVQSSYYIVTNPNAWFTAFASCGDHTTGTGNMMVFDGATNPAGTTPAWCSGSTITVEPNTNYTFSYYVASVAPENPARLEVLINGVSLGAPTIAPSSTCQWTLVSLTWDSGTSTTADICIYNRETAGGGNDFALDDISFKETVTCLYEKTVTITVTPQTVPTFTAIPAICSGGTLNALPTTSLNGITGNWSPALNNTATTTYTFTPDSGQCASTTTLEIVVNQPVTPTFNAVAAICSGGTLNALPTTSLNGISGSWSPALNNTATTTYTFTPSVGECAVTTTLEIVVNQPVVPTFGAIDTTVCSEATIDPLPTTSLNGFTGSWSPALNNTATTTYTFTPTAGQCATSPTITIEVTPLPEFTITQGCVDNNYTLAAVETNSSSPSYAWYDASNNQIGTSQSVVVTASGTYKLVITQNGCSEEEEVEVANTLCSFDIQKGISANGDGYNDNFELTGFDVKKLQIFNRYGMKVYSRNNYTNEWYGQSDKGDELPDGTYYYVIDRNSGKTVTGWIYINREQ